MRAFILAGGFATRLWPLTEKRAKPLLPLDGKPILTHLLGKIPAGIPVTVSTNAALAEGFTRWMSEHGRSDVELVVEGTRSDDRKLGTLGALAQWIAGHGIDEDVLVLTGDNYFTFPFDEFLGAYREGVPLLAAHDIRSTERAKGFGTVIVDPADPRKIVAFEEKPPQPRTTLVSTGASVLPRGTLPILLAFAKEKPDNVGGIFEEFLRQGVPVEAYHTPHPWFDVGSFASYLDAHRHVVRGAASVAPEATVEGCEFTGSVAIGRGSIVRKSRLEDTIVFEDCRIEDCSLKNCVVDQECRLRGVDLSNKMIRAGTVLEME